MCHKIMGNRVVLFPFILTPLLAFKENFHSFHTVHDYRKKLDSAYSEDTSEFQILTGKIFFN